MHSHIPKKVNKQMKESEMKKQKGGGWGRRWGKCEQIKGRMRMNEEAGREEKERKEIGEEGGMRGGRRNREVAGSATPQEPGGEGEI